MKPKQTLTINNLIPFPSEVPREETIECNDVFLDNSMLEEKISTRIGFSRLIFVNEINSINSISE